jgi:Carboxypeptidase regulatory-like domain
MNMRVWSFALFCILALTAAPTIGVRAVQTPAASTGVLIGVVTDESGTPLVGARVQAVGRRKKWAGPYYESPTGNPDESDDRGQFRLHSLPPGRYVVAVSVQSKMPAQNASSGYMRTYNPGTTSLADAQPLAVEGGKEQSVSIRVTPVRFMEVSGLAMTSAGEPAANFDVWLRGGPATIGYTGVQGGYMTTMVATARTAQDGAFSLSRVPAGAYTLTVTNGRARRGRPLEIAEIPVEVTNASITGIKVATARGATVSGRLEWAGRGPVPWPRNATLGRIRATAVGREFDFASLDTEVQPDGTFRFTDLYGLRRIQSMGLAFDWAIQSVDGAKEVLAEPNLSIKPGAEVTDVRVVVTNRTGTLMATVTDEESKPFLTGSVLLMSRNASDIDPLGWGYRATQQNRGSNGVWYYAMDGVLPGSYLAAAIDVEPYRLTGDADLMERARAAAVAVEIREGQTPLSLRVVRLRPFVQGPQ